jgi:hypothetical protein
MSCIRSCYDKDSSNFGHDDCPTCIHKDSPPQRDSSATPLTWVGLSDDNKVLINHDANFNQFMTAGEYADRVQQLTEARLKDLNT